MFAVAVRSFQIERKIATTAASLSALGSNFTSNNAGALYLNSSVIFTAANTASAADLSGGDFISNFGPQEGLASYRFDAAQAGSYTFWIRANPVGDPKLDYRLDEGNWTPVDFKSPADLINIASDNKPDLRFIADFAAIEINELRQLHVASQLHTGSN